MIPIFKPFMPELSEVNSILHSGALAYGKWTKAFESRLKDYLGSEDILCTNTYNSAMLVLLATLGLNNGSEVLASPVSCLASNQPFLNRGIKVKWVDVDPATGTLDPDHLRKSITSSTKAIFHNHHCGIPGYIDEINQIGKEYGLFVVDDCIESFGSEYKNKILGSTGADASVYSFQTVRLPNTIDGGAVRFSNPDLHYKASLLRDYGIDRRNFRDKNNEISHDLDISMEGYGALMSDVNGYIGHEQMEFIPELLDQQRENAKSWKRVFTNKYPEVEILGDREEINPNYWVLSILTPNKAEMLQYFRSIGYYASGIHINNNIYSAFGDMKPLKGVDDFMSRHLALPCGWWFNHD